MILFVKIGLAALRFIFPEFPVTYGEQFPAHLFIQIKRISKDCKSDVMPMQELQ